MPYVAKAVHKCMAMIFRLLAHGILLAKTDMGKKF